MTAVVTDVLVASETVLAVIDVLLVELVTVVVPCDAIVAEPTETEVAVPGLSVVAEARGVADAVWVDGSVLPLVVASIPTVVKRVSVSALVSPEVVAVGVMAAVVGDVALTLVEAVEAP